MTGRGAEAHARTSRGPHREFEDLLALEGKKSAKLFTVHHDPHVVFRVILLFSFISVSLTQVTSVVSAARNLGEVVVVR